MARKCDLTGRGPATGNNVSHAHNKTKRKFMVNLQQVSLHSETLGTAVKMRISTGALRTVTKLGGIDNFLRKTPDAKLAAEGLKLKRQIVQAERKRNSKKAAAAA